MAAKDVYEHGLIRWEQEISYAEPLRSRRNLFTTGLALVTGLGLFRLDPRVASDQAFAVGSEAARISIVVLVFLALGLFLLGGLVLYTRGDASEDETAALAQATGVDSERLGKRRPGRASTYLVLDRETEEALLAADEHASWLIRAKKLQIATKTLAASNRRVSNRIRSAGVLIAGGYLALAFAVGVHTAFTHV